MARMTKEDAQKLMNDVAEEFAFRCCDGRTFKNMQELKNGLETMADETFAFHLTTDKNVFSNWVKYIIMDQKLARDLSKSANKTQATKAVIVRHSFLESKLT